MRTGLHCWLPRIDEYDLNDDKTRYPRGVSNGMLVTHMMSDYMSEHSDIPPERQVYLKTCANLKGLNKWMSLSREPVPAIIKDRLPIFISISLVLHD